MNRTHALGMLFVLTFASFAPAAPVAVVVELLDGTTRSGQWAGPDVIAFVDAKTGATKQIEVANLLSVSFATDERRRIEDEVRILSDLTKQLPKQQGNDARKEFDIIAARLVELAKRDLHLEKYGVWMVYRDGEQPAVLEGALADPKLLFEFQFEVEGPNSPTRFSADQLRAIHFANVKRATSNVLPRFGPLGDDVAKPVHPSAGVVAVWQLPVVTPLGAFGQAPGCGDKTGGECKPPELICAKDPACNCKDYKSFFFERPAHFPLPRFTAEGAPVEVEGALVYEGMNLTLYDNGNFELHFVAATLAHPVTIRLAFLVQPPVDSRLAPIQLTIPPVIIQPDEQIQRKASNNHWRVSYVGYSPFLANGQSFGTCTVERRGTARFGYEPGRGPSLYQY